MINRQARAVKYQSARDYEVANFASRTMRWTGIIVAAVPRLPPRRPHVGLGQPRASCAARCTATSTPASPRLPVAILYIVANIALGIHLFHGTWSLFQSLGLEQPAVQQVAPRAAPPAIATLIVVGNVLVPDRRPRRHRSIYDCAASTARRPSWRPVGRSRSTPRSPTARSPTSGTNYKADAKLVNPTNKRKFKVIVVGTGLAGASAAATLAELGYQVDAFTFHDSPRRAHSIAAQGGINAAKNYRGDGDSVYRLFYDTVKGGDFRSREAQRLPPGRGVA